MSDSFSSFFGLPVDIEYILANPPPELDYVLPDLPAGIVGKLIGPGGMGKTMLELEIAILSATGLLQRDHLFGPKSCDALTTAPQKVVLLAAEEPLVVLWQRVHHIVHSLKQREVLPEGMSWLEFRDLLRANLLMFPLAGAKRVNLLTDDLQPSETALALGRLCEGVRLLIADPLRQLHLADENQSSPMSALMSVFKQIAHDTGAAVLVAHHTSRAASLQGYGGSADAGRGSTALKDDSRWEINLKPPTRKMLDDHGIHANLRMDGGLDGVNYQAVFQPPADRWVDVVLPLNVFSPRYRGQPVSNAPTLRPERVCQVGWMVADGQTGAFQLAIRTVTCLGQATAAGERSRNDVSAPSASGIS